MILHHYKKQAMKNNLKGNFDFGDSCIECTYVTNIYDNKDAQEAFGTCRHAQSSYHNKTVGINNSCDLFEDENRK